MSWAVISLAVIIVGMLVFAYADYDAKNYSKLNKANKFRITLFKAYGMNPLLIYILAVAPDRGTERGCSVGSGNTGLPDL